MPTISIAATIAILKDAGAALQAAGKVDLWNKVSALQAQLIDMQGDLVAKDEEILALKKANGELSEQARFAATLTFNGHCYFAEGDPFPLCMACWDLNKRAVHLQDVGEVTSGYRRDCPVCKTMSIDRSKARAAGSIRPMRVYGS